MSFLPPRRSTACPPNTARRARALFSVLVATLAAVGWPAADAAAQNTVEPAARFTNLTQFTRSEWGTATVPFPRGAFRPGDRFEVPGVPSTIEPFGAPWPDGSYRFGRLTARLENLLPGEERLLPVRASAAPATLPPFEAGPWTQTAIAGFQVEIFAQLGGTFYTAPFTLIDVVESTDARQTLLYRGRIPNTDLVYDLWITHFAGQDHARWELRVINADTTSHLWRSGIKSLGMLVHGALPFVQHAVWHGTQSSPPMVGGTNAVFFFQESTEFYDGQGVEYYGSFLFASPSVVVPDAAERIDSALASSCQEMIGVATNWPESGAFGPFGTVPEKPPWFSQFGRPEAEHDLDAFETTVNIPSILWEDRRPGLMPQAGAPGDQNDFGTSQWGEIVAAGLPHQIALARWAAGEEIHRPTHFREHDGTPVRAASHPDWTSWNGRTHRDNQVSPDRLGKPWPEPWLSRRAHVWTGKNHSHWSSLTLASSYLLTTSYSLRAEIDNDIELYLSSHTLPSQVNRTTNRIGSARAVGRTLLSMAWHYVATGRSDVRERIRGRVEECIAQQYDGLRSIGPVRPLMISVGDPRVGVTAGDLWVPWQEGLAVIGLDAAARVTGSQAAQDLAYTCAQSLLKFGWGSVDGQLRVGYAVHYDHLGKELTPAQYQDPDYVEWASSQAFRYWCLPATRIAREFALLQGDVLTAQRATAIENIVIADRGVTNLQWDRFADWSAN